MLDNQMTQTQGKGVRQVMTAPARQSPSQPYWSQYHRVHNRLAVMLPPGVPHHKPGRRSYNLLTGKHYVYYSLYCMILI